MILCRQCWLYSELYTWGYDSMFLYWVMIICTPLDGTNYELYWSKWYEYIWFVHWYSSIFFQPNTRDVKRHHLQRIPKAVCKDFFLRFPKHIVPEGQAFGRRISFWGINFRVLQVCEVWFHFGLTDMHSNDATDLNVLHLESTSFRSWGISFPGGRIWRVTCGATCRTIAERHFLHCAPWGMTSKTPLILGVFNRCFCIEVCSLDWGSPA